MSRYTGCTGGVRGLQCLADPEGRMLLACCSLDRYLRVYSLESPKLLHKVRTCQAALHPSCMFKVVVVMAAE